MKKLMTMLSAVALAFGVQAAGTWYSGTSFETMTAGQALDLTSGEGLMWATNGAPTLTVEALPSNPYSAGLRPDYFRNPVLSGDEATYYNALSVKTAFGNPVYRTNETVKTMGEVYVDALVKPTICEDDEISLDSGAKIAIWFKEIRDANDDPVSTNLMITAGYLTSPTTAVSTNYDCGVITDGADQWQRFTVKSFATIDSRSGTITPGFVVYRNGARVTSAAAKGDSGVSTFNNLDIQAGVYYAKNALFPSRVQGGDTTARQQISAIGFDGTGSVDDILFSNDEPSWAAPFKTVRLTWDEHVTGFTYQVGSKAEVTKSGLNAAGSELVAVEENDVIQITDDTYATDYKADPDGFTAGTGISVEGKSFSIVSYSTYVDGTAANIVSKYDAPNVLIDGTDRHYPTLAEAFDAISSMSGAVGMTLAADLAFDGTSLSLSGEDLTGVTLDLAGHTITYTGSGYAFDVSKPFTITNSTVTVGGITASQVVTSSDSLTIYNGVFSGAVTITAGDAAISGGTFNGAVSADEGIEGFITGGTFAADYTLDGYIANGYAATGIGTPPTAWVVGLGSYTIEYYDSLTSESFENTPEGYVFGDTITPATPTAPTGYAFAGWTWKDAESGDVITYVAGETFGDLELWANWTPYQYTVTVGAPGANATVAVVTNSIAAGAASGDYVVNYWDSISVTYTANSGYHLTVDTSTNIEHVAANVTIAAPTVEADPVYIESISLNTNELALTVAEEFLLVATTTPALTPDDSIVWESSDSTVVTVGNNGGLTAVAAGSATITAKSSHDSSVNATCSVTVSSSGPAPIDPSTSDTTVVDAPSTATAAEVEAMVDIAAPAGYSTEDATAYKANFTKTATYNEGTGWTVKVTIAETVQNTVEAAAVTALTTAENTVTIPKGLYYRITPSAGLPISGTAQTGQSDGSAITVTKPASTTAGFFKVELSAKAFN